MHSFRRILAFVSGLALISTVLLLAPSLSMLALPPLMTDFIGADSRVLAQLWRSALFCLPMLALAMLWTWVTLRARQRSRRQTLLWYRAGMMLAIILWYSVGFVLLASYDTRNKAWSTISLLTSSRVPPFWGLQNAGAALLGAWLGSRLLPRRTPHRHAHSHGDDLNGDAGTISASQT